MKLHVRKRESTVQQTLALLLCLICMTAIVFFYCTLQNTGDKQFDALFGATVPRFFISVFLLVLTMELFPDCLVLKRVSPKNLIWCALPLLVAIVNFPFSALIGGTAHVMRPGLIWLLMIKCLMIGLSEELLFRAVILSSLSEFFRKKRRSCFLPVLLSSVIFALFHFINFLDGAGILAVLQQVGYSFLIGAMLAITLLKTENLGLCVFLHALFDFGGCLLSDVGTGSPHDTVFWILTVTIGVLCAVQMLITLIKSMKKVP